LPVEFVIDDAQALHFEDASFDACRTERMLMHVSDAERAFAEMVRVIRRGGRPSRGPSLASPPATKAIVTGFAHAHKLVDPSPSEIQSGDVRELVMHWNRRVHQECRR
jgi:ubiquinone/menaquinone biosynthesis C-methylase UbiE